MFDSGSSLKQIQYNILYGAYGYPNILTSFRYGIFNKIQKRTVDKTILKTISFRSIRHFMIQGGDPTGTGSGGDSYWGGTFKVSSFLQIRVFKVLLRIMIWTKVGSTKGFRSGSATQINICNNSLVNVNTNDVDLLYGLNLQFRT